MSGDSSPSHKMVRSVFVDPAHYKLPGLSAQGIDKVPPSYNKTSSPLDRVALSMPGLSFADTQRPRVAPQPPKRAFDAGRCQLFNQCPAQPLTLRTSTLRSRAVNFKKLAKVLRNQWNLEEVEDRINTAHYGCLPPLRSQPCIR